MENYGQKIKIIIAEPVELLREGIILSLNQFSDIQILGAAANGPDAVSLAIEWVPDVALLNWQLDRADGVACAKEIKYYSPTVRTVLFSDRPVNKSVLDQLNSTIVGFLNVDMSGDVLARAIRAVAAGERYLSPDATSALLKTVRHKNRPDSALSNRELEILQLMAQIETYRDIAQHLHISENTVRTYVRRILKKLSQPNRTLAVVEGLRRNLITLDLLDKDLSSD